MNKKDGQWFNEKIGEIQSSFSDYINDGNVIRPHNATLKIIAIYIFIGSVWIMLSDRLLSSLVKDIDLLITMQTYKGWLYVFISGIVFYVIIYRRIYLYKISTDTVFRGYEELSSTYEELLAMDEELSQQFNEHENTINLLEESEQRYNLAVEGANDGIWEWDIENGVYFSSLKWISIFGYNDEEVPRTYNSWIKLVHKEDRESVDKDINEYLISRLGILENTFRLRCKSGDYRWVLCKGKGIWDEKGNLVKLAGSHTDITDYVELQDSFYKREELYSNIVNGAAVFILGINKDEKIIEFSPFAEKITGYKKEEVLGANWSDLFIPYESKKHTKSVITKILNGENLINQENKIITKDGRTRDILWNNSTIHDRHGNVIGAIGVGADITDYKSMEKELYNLAYYDQLTGLPNRQKFEIMLNERIDIDKDTGEKFALLYLDLDDFKRINDIYGHSYGDILLKKVASALKTIVENENLARLSGDEFAIIISNVKDTADLYDNITNIMELVNRAWNVEGNEFYITSSVGITIYPDDGTDLQTLLKNADTAMYEAKENSKNCYAMYTSKMHDKTLKALSMEKDLRNALLKDEFLVYYQPIIDFVTGEIVGLEALIRWMHPDKGLISPVEFIPFAEKTGLIVEIGEVVIVKVYKQLKKWYELGICNIKISINLSAIQIKQHNFINRIIDLTEEMGINGENIIFEITENIGIYDLKHTINVLKMLKSMNIKVALDDFGTGYSSLSYLQKFPIDIIKIDREFIKNITKNSNEQFITKLIISIAHSMSCVVTAEGIETLEQYNKLKSYRCDFAQGYLLSKPLPVDEIESMLISKKRFDY